MLTGSFWPSARASFVLDSLLLAWMIVALVFPVGMLVLDWIKARASLLESETYLILFTVGIYLSMWFGLANYVSYFVNKDSFSIDKQLEQAQETESQQRLGDSVRVARACEEVARLLQQEPRETLQLVKVTHDSYRTVLTGSNAVLDLVLYHDWDEPHPSSAPTAYVKSFSATVGAQTTSFDAERAQFSWTQLSYLRYLQRPETGIPKSLLISTFQERAQWERDFASSGITAGIIHRPIPVSLFLYQAVMDTVGASPKYFTPASFASRLLALVYAVCKFIFFGMLVAALMKQFTSKASKPDEAKGARA